MVDRLYVGPSGELAARAELLLRGYNPSRPDVDVGDDLYVHAADQGSLFRVQVKTSKAIKLASGAYRAQFDVRRKHVFDVSASTHYVLVARCGIKWRVVVLRRGRLSFLLKKGFLGSKRGEGYNVRIVFRGPKIAHASSNAGAFDLSRYAGRWKLLKRGARTAASN